MIVLKKNGLIDEDKLTKNEKDIFVEFLKLERERHQEDIVKIARTINKILRGKNNGR